MTPKHCTPQGTQTSVQPPGWEVLRQDFDPFSAKGALLPCYAHVAAACSKWAQALPLVDLSFHGHMHFVP